MAGTKTSALTAGIVPVATDVFPSVQSAALVKVTASQLRQYVGAGLSNASVASVAAGYAADTYLAGSAITIPTAGGWRVGTIYQCSFDMTKTAAGTAALVVTIRMGTLGTIGDAAILTMTRSAGTAVADTGLFNLFVTFRTVGSGTSAVIQCAFLMSHVTNGGGLDQAIAVDTAAFTSAGFNSTTQTIIGVSFNGGASFSGTNTLVQASALNI
jgi:hypothetical protein